VNQKPSEYGKKAAGTAFFFVIIYTSYFYYFCIKNKGFCVKV